MTKDWPDDLRPSDPRRLPRAPDRAAAAEAKKIGTPAALTVAERLSAGSPPDPEVASAQRTFRAVFFPQGTGISGGVMRDRVLAVVRSRGPGQPGDPSRLADELDTPESWHEYLYRTCWMACWPLMLPAHRDAAAADVSAETRACPGVRSAEVPMQLVAV